MVRVVRESKFRHIYGQPTQKDQQFEGVTASATRLEANLCATNVKFIAVVLSTSGAGVFTVMDRYKPGRFDNVFRCIHHNSEVLDVTFDPFNANRIVSGSDDGTFAFWWIPDGGLVADLHEPLASIKSSQRRVVQAIWHTSASDVVFLVNVDSISIYELKTYECVRKINTSSYCDTIYHVSLNHDSTKIACTFKDKKVRVFDTYNGSLLKEFDLCDTPKPTRVAFVHGIGDKLCTTYFSKRGERSVALWDLDDTSKPIWTEEVDKGVSVLNIYYDADCSLVAVYGKGESIIRIFELEPTGQMFLVHTYQQGEQQKTGAFSEKLACNPTQNEVMHFLKVTVKGSETIAFIVPRRSDDFQTDLFPDTDSNIPAITSEDFVNGKVASPLKISMQDFIVANESAMPEKQPLKSSVSVSKQQMPSRQYNPGSPSDLSARVAKLEKEVEELKKIINQ